MKIDHQKLQTAYLAKVNKICEDCEDKSHFGIPEIVSIIAELIGTGKFYLPPSKTSVLELCDTWRKLSHEWSAETNAFVDELYGRLEWAETENAVFNLRLNKNWTAGSNLYSQKEVDALEDQNYNAGFLDGQESCQQPYDGHFIR